MLYMAIVESILLIVILFFFKEMYLNKYGQYSTQKESISDDGEKEEKYNVSDNLQDLSN